MVPLFGVVLKGSHTKPPVRGQKKSHALRFLEGTLDEIKAARFLHRNPPEGNHWETLPSLWLARSGAECRSGGVTEAADAWRHPNFDYHK